MTLPSPHSTEEKNIMLILGKGTRAVLFMTMVLISAVQVLIKVILVVVCQIFRRDPRAGLPHRRQSLLPDL